MAQANSDNSITSRRRFLAVSGAASVASVGTLAVAAMPPAALQACARAAAADPVFDVIARHSEINQRVAAMEAAGVPDYDEFSDLSVAEMDLFLQLLETVPTTLAGIVGLVTYLERVRQKDPWKFEDSEATPLITALAQAFQQIGSAA